VKWFLLKRIKELSQEYKDDWSIAVLVPSNAIMITISDMLGKSQRLSDGRVAPSIEHDVAIEAAGPALAATFIAHLLELGSQGKCHFSNVVLDLCEHILGRKGEKTPSQSDSVLTTVLSDYINTQNFDKPIRGSARQKIMAECIRISNTVNGLVLSGDVAQDWISVRAILSETTISSIKRLHSDSLFVKLLRKGTLLNSSLGQIWRQHGNYFGATDAVRDALTQEHFASSLRVWRGVNVMTIHKSKGKEFDEVLVFEGAFQGQRFVYSDADMNKARISLRVAATRAKQKAYFVTPSSDPCPLLLVASNYRFTDRRVL
jgi:DNA helicase-2/ATP-dependent DNA helicase PcrA